MNKCTRCGKKYDVGETQRVYGEAPWTFGMCSAKCYTEHQVESQPAPEGFQCVCGNERFVGHQVCRIDVIVDGHNDFQDNLVSDKEIGDSIYDSETPYGPYTCTECGAEYEDLSLRRSRLMRVQKDIKDNF